MGHGGASRRNPAQARGRKVCSYRESHGAGAVGRCSDTTAAALRRQRAKIVKLPYGLAVLLACAVMLGTVSTTSAAGTLTNQSATAPVFQAVEAGDFRTCGLTTEGTVACWGNPVSGNVWGEATPPAGTFTSVGAGGVHNCGVRPEGTVACWGSNEYGQATPPAGTFTSVSSRAMVISPWPARTRRAASPTSSRSASLRTPHPRWLAGLPCSASSQVLAPDPAATVLGLLAGHRPDDAGGKPPLRRGEVVVTAADHRHSHAAALH